MDAAKSSVRANPKPVNVFYVWYTELCRRMNCSPAPAVKPAKPKCQTVLEFVADRLKVEEWGPIINALRQDTSLHVINIKSRIGNCQFLHDIDTEEKAKHMKRRFGTLWTAYVLRQLLRSLSTSLRNTQVLTCLELDGLPMFSQYLEPLLQGLKKNKTVKLLSFANCAINDAGCQLVCAYLRFTPNVEIVNLSGCNLSAESGEHLAKLIKHQQINRYCESWHNSLRYENPQSGVMRGIKRITINCNPDFGDDGFNQILDELEDDLWIKALDLQRCGITEALANKIIDVIHYNRSLEIVDLRQNDSLNILTVEKVLQILRDKHASDYRPEYQWCNTAVSLAWNSVHESASKFSFKTSNLHKTESAPVKKNCSKDSAFNLEQSTLRKSKTVDNVQKKNGLKIDKNYLIGSEQKVSELNIKLKSEIQKRKEIEKRNEELKQKLEKIKSTVRVQAEENAVGKKSKLSQLPDKHKLLKHSGPSNHKERHSNNEKNGFQRVKPINGKKKEYQNSVVPNGLKNGFKNVFSSKIISNACKIFESLLHKESSVDKNIDEEDLMHYLTIGNSSKVSVENLEESDSEEYSKSQASLYKYMEEIKNMNSKKPPLNHNCKGTSKYAIKENQKR